MKKVEDNGRQRFYELDKPITKGRYAGFDVDIIAENMNDAERLTPAYAHLKECFSEPIKYVCVSDAHTHIERLVFSAFFNEKTGKYLRTHTVVDGKNTFMIDGGNYDAVYDDEVYLRHLMIINV